MEPDRHRIAAEALDALAAEREPHLQPAVFVEPPQYAAYAGMRSFVVFGDSGSGKTALRLALMRRTAPADAPPMHLVVQWQPDPVEGVQGSPAVRLFVRQALEACATTLLTTFARHPYLFHNAPPTAQTALHWFIQTFAGQESASSPCRHRRGGRVCGRCLPLPSPDHRSRVAGAARRRGRATHHCAPDHHAPADGHARRVGHG